MMRLSLAAATAALLASAASAQPAGGRQANPDADGYGKVTFAEFSAIHSQRNARMFARLDANNDSKLVAAEMAAMGQRAQASGGAQAAGGRMLQRMDIDGDGSVTKAEMDADGGKRRFDAADANKDGWLSPEELSMMRQNGAGGGQGPA
ncbi:EF-hand domain-containing protein [Phenylobacterium sp.]|uniref:EF-hand domain-containing protein n=1 Tax=Phenylobacterium sp. TaxID=1871053 RepID=UPI00398357F7